MKASLRHPALLVLSLTLGLPHSSQAMDLDGLVKNSPFGQATTGPGGRDIKAGNLEFRGMYVDGGVTYFSIYNNQTKQSSWVAEGQAPSGLVPVSIKEFDPINETLVVENAGQPVKLALRQVTVGKVEAPQPVNLGLAQGAPMPQVAQAAPEVSQEKLQAFRDEMRKRFADRQNNGGSPDGNNFGGGKFGRNRGGDNGGGTPTAVPSKNGGNTSRGGAPTQSN